MDELQTKNEMRSIAIIMSRQTRIEKRDLTISQKLMLCYCYCYVCYATANVQKTAELLNRE